MSTPTMEETHVVLSAVESYRADNPAEADVLLSSLGDRALYCVFYTLVGVAETIDAIDQESRHE
jgi:hypothetical protein